MRVKHVYKIDTIERPETIEETSQFENQMLEPLFF